MPDRYARYTRLHFDRPHPHVLRIVMGMGQERPNPVDAVMHANWARSGATSTPIPR